MVGPYERMRNEIKISGKTYIELGLQCRKMILEHAHDFCPGSLPTWNLDAACGMRSKVNQLLKLWMFKGLDWL